MTPRNRPLRFTGNIAHDKVMDRWHIRKMIGGRVIQLSFPTKRLAVMTLEALVADAVAAAYGLEVAEAPRTLEDVFEEYIGERKLYGRSEQTITHYRWASVGLYKHLGKTHSPVLNRSTVNEYVSKRQADGATNAAIVRELKVLRTVVRHVIGEQALTWQLPALNVPPAVRLLPSDDEIRAIWQALKDRPDVRTAIILGVLTGMRAGDVLQAGPSWRRGELIDVPMSKRRGIVNTLPVVATLAAHLGGLEGPRYVPCTAASIKMVLQRLTRPKDKDTPPLVATARPWHGLGHLRHICATWAAQARHDEESVGLVLGHAGRTVARRHYITDESVAAKKKVLESVEGRWLKVITNRRHLASKTCENVLEFSNHETRKCL